MDEGFNRIIKWDNQSHVRFRSKVLPGGLLKWCGHFWSTFRFSLFQELESFDPQVLHLNGFSTVIQWQAWLWATLRGRKIVVRGDGDTLRNTSSPKRNCLAVLLTKIFSRRVDHFFYQGEENRKYWLERGARENCMTWVPCVPDSRVYRQAAFPTFEERTSFRSSLGVQGDDCVFLVSGKLEHRKRPHDALAALAVLKVSSAKLWFVGSGVLSDELQGQATEFGITPQVRFWGFQNQTRLPKILQAADVCLHLSEHDPWPYSVLECALSGQALLLSDRTGSHPDLINRIRGGMTFCCGDIRDLAEKMRLFCSDKCMLQNYQNQLRQLLGSYTEVKFCEIVENVILNLLNEV